MSAIILAIISMFKGFDIHHAVPNLDYLPLEEAEDRLADQCLDFVVVPVVRSDIEVGRVVPNSQSLSPGQLVRSNTKVSLSVSDEGTSALAYPRSNSQVDCIRRSEGFCTITVEGMASALVSRDQLRLLLWAKSRESGWYLQDSGPTQTILDRPDQTWTRQAQIGNSRYPPSDGELVDLALTVIPSGSKGDARGKYWGKPFREPEGWPVGTAEHISIRLMGEH